MRFFARREAIPALLVLVALGIGALESRYFLDVRYLLDSSSMYVETGLLVLGMTLVIIGGQIDLSVASMTALVACCTAKALVAGWPVPVALLAGVGLGCFLGWVNGALVSRLGLPSFVVTLATMAGYRIGRQSRCGNASEVDGHHAGIANRAFDSLCNLSAPALFRHIGGRTGAQVTGKVDLLARDNSSPGRRQFQQIGEFGKRVNVDLQLRQVHDFAAASAGPEPQLSRFVSETAFQRARIRTTASHVP